MGSTKITISGTMGFSIGALIIRIGFWAHYTIIIIIRSPPKKIWVIIKAPKFAIFAARNS